MITCVHCVIPKLAKCQFLRESQTSGGTTNSVTEYLIFIMFPFITPENRVLKFSGSVKTGFLKRNGLRITFAWHFFLYKTVENTGECKANHKSKSE